jgi:phosphopantothenate synthetase
MQLSIITPIDNRVAALTDLLTNGNSIGLDHEHLANKVQPLHGSKMTREMIRRIRESLEKVQGNRVEILTVVQLEELI